MLIGDSCYSNLQLKDMALKASGAYRHCNPCTGPAGQSRFRNSGESDAESDRFRWSYRRTGSSSSTTPRTWGKEMEARLKGISSGEATPKSMSRRRADPIVYVLENEPKEWVAQVEPGVLITFVSLPRGGNDLKRIRFRYAFLSQLHIYGPYTYLILSFNRTVNKRLLCYYSFSGAHTLLIETLGVVWNPYLAFQKKRKYLQLLLHIYIIIHPV